MTPTAGMRRQLLVGGGYETPVAVTTQNSYDTPAIGKDEMDKKHTRLDYVNADAIREQDALPARPARKVEHHYENSGVAGMHSNVGTPVLFDSSKKSKSP